MTREPTVGICRAIKKPRDRNESWELNPACVHASVSVIMEARWDLCWLKC